VQGIFADGQHFEPVGHGEAFQQVAPIAAIHLLVRGRVDDILPREGQGPEYMPHVDPEHEAMRKLTFGSEVPNIDLGETVDSIEPCHHLQIVTCNTMPPNIDKISD
jgi:hypothetical protein